MGWFPIAQPPAYPAADAVVQGGECFSVRKNASGLSNATAA